MSKEKNVAMVQKTKEVLKEMGFEVKTTQIYEMYSKIIGEKNWNIAKTKNTDFLDHLLDSYDLVELVKNIENLNATKVITRLHKEQGHGVTALDSSLDNFGISHIIQWSPEIKVPVMTLCDKDQKSFNYKNLTGKNVIRLKRAMNLHGCSHGIIYTSMIRLPMSIYKMAIDEGIEIVDLQDMVKIATQIMNQKQKS